MQTITLNNTDSVKIVTPAGTKIISTLDDGRVFETVWYDIPAGTHNVRTK